MLDIKQRNFESGTTNTITILIVLILLLIAADEYLKITFIDPRFAEAHDKLALLHYRYPS